MNKEMGGTREVYGRSEEETSRVASPLFIGTKELSREVWMRKQFLPTKVRHIA